MKTASKKNTQHPTPKKIENQAKGLKRSKSTQFLVPKRTSKKMALERDTSQENILTHSLAKSKSAKSIKTKPKSQHKRETTTKKSKVKRLLSPQPTKKQAPRQSNQNSSILSDWVTKKQQPQYFFYGNTYIPIENSAQRRLVYRIQKIDLENKENKEDEIQNKATADTFLLQNTEQKGTWMEKEQQKDSAVGDGNVLTGQESVQTQTQQRQNYDEPAQKCFADVLTELQFLYMPNEANFEPFSPQERLHYGQMLEAIAKKMLSSNGHLVTQNQSVLNQDQITVLLYQREGIQVGALEHVPSAGFPTHLLAILAYLKNLFCFLDYNYKEDVITNLRSFYGLNYNQRVAKLSRRFPHEKDSKFVMSQDIFQAFEYEMFKDYDFGSELVKQAVHVHNRAIFDAVNNQLQAFRPFFSSEGEPFPWTINLGMTHYDITEEALYIIFMQVKEKIQKMVVTLCGMHLDFDDNDLPAPNKAPSYVKKTNDRIQKMTVEQIKNYDDRVQLDYQRSMMNFELEEDILFELISELEQDLMTMKVHAEVESQADSQLQGEFDFQFQE